MNRAAIRLSHIFMCLFPFTSKHVSDLCAAVNTERKHPVTVRDSIESTMSVLDDYRFPTGVFNPGHLAQFSPDGKNFIIVVRKGNVQQDTNEYSMLLFRTQEIWRSPTPQIMLTMSSSPNREAIKDLVWLAENETVAFLGENPNEQRQLYTFVPGSASQRASRLRRVNPLARH